jgi:hypothetical protein
VPQSADVDLRLDLQTLPLENQRMPLRQVLTFPDAARCLITICNDVPRDRINSSHLRG